MDISHKLSTLAQRYETREFLDGDPSWFMHQVEGDANKELLAFIASSLSYGSRKQFLPKIQYILECSKGKIKEWLLSGKFREDIPNNDECFYRLYSNHIMHEFLEVLTTMLKEYGSLKAYVQNTLLNTPPYPNRQTITAIRALTYWFASHNAKEVIPKDCTSSCKRLCMFLRWMVRDGSPVDLGLWADMIDKHTLIIPLDTHVMQEANRLGLLESKTASMSTALKLTEKLRIVFPDDPLKGDFALFGVGVNQ